MQKQPKMKYDPKVRITITRKISCLMKNSSIEAVLLQNNR